MRIGVNPGKEDPNLMGYGLHRLIMPVYIPNTEGYFAEAVDILQLCLESLRLTKKAATAVTIAANGCCQPVLALLEAEMAGGWIDQLVIHARNRGKIDAIIGAARASFEPVITFADSDVLFRPGWDSAVERIFSAFPECGYVCPFPHPGSECSFTASTFLGALCERAISFRAITDRSDLDTFNRSIGRTDLCASDGPLGHLAITRGDVTVCIGAGHFVCSLRREVMRAMPAKPALRAVGISEPEWFDTPPDRLGYWKLSTTKAYVQHMGNRPEPYMTREVAALRAMPPAACAEAIPLGPMRRHCTALLPYWFRARLGLRLGRWFGKRCRKRAARANSPSPAR